MCWSERSDKDKILPSPECNESGNRVGKERGTLIHARGSYWHTTSQVRTVTISDSLAKSSLKRKFLNPKDPKKPRLSWMISRTLCCNNWLALQAET